MVRDNNGAYCSWHDVPFPGRDPLEVQSLTVAPLALGAVPDALRGSVLSGLQKNIEAYDYHFTVGSAGNSNPNPNPNPNPIPITLLGRQGPSICCHSCRHMASGRRP